MSPSCSEFRNRHLDRAAAADAVEGEVSGHRASCEACRQWAVRQQVLVRALTRLPSLAAPAELDERVGEALVAAGKGVAQDAPSSNGSWRVAAALRGARRLQAPAALDELVASELRTRITAPPIRGAADVDELLSGLDRVQAPSVLDRLVAEEIADPAAARARRFAGDLDSIEAPSELQGRILYITEARPALVPESPPATPSRPGRLLRWRTGLASGLVAAAAIVLLLQISGPRGGGHPTTELVAGQLPPRLTNIPVVQLSSHDELPELAKGMLTGMTGGILDASPSLPGGEGAPK